ncbi:hypothetical protein [Dactylosporangium matsuzakiense]|uniref:Uncharacterized protein n=1 Tax=Dactylosporangium matsuzakiense TaxID=53360 RepID=A0A9W6KLD6_9ACTN|nr:hypothetical protein [Dactylosporangium matsuzakiense]UWZ41560.1 hypothetical protein Dmats_28335 [Dactylosporangium matsuzakiense]GLL02376.1 hypothetical protein GCM10017581_041180 [Dactylosporangium matsuzakiense]
MTAVAEALDRHERRRRAALAGVSARLRAVGIEPAFGVLTQYYDFYGKVPTGLTGLTVDEPHGTGRMQVTVVAAERLVPPGEGGLSADGHVWTRDVDIEHDLPAAADLVFEVTLLEGPAEASGAMWAPRRLVRDEEAVVDAVRLWHGYREMLRATPPKPATTRRRSARARLSAARRDAAASPMVRRPAAVPPPLRAHLDGLDDARLAFHFPRDRSGRYARSAVVALAGDGTALSRRGPWLSARADGAALVVGVEPLIGANQDHRWDRLPWLWSNDETPAAVRWQVDDPGRARATVERLDAFAVAEALTACGVEVDADLTALLNGYPVAYGLARHTDTWVKRLYDQLQLSAPWRLAAAYAVHQQERRAVRRPDGEPVALFGLKGLNQQSKPMVGLDAPGGGPRLRMIWTASNARLPRALWECPADLLAELT